ncbi:MAG: AbrB/MazE/SpoVT family DNA-binding domain-containing protein [Firmicutes bacterium]|nr:AbrB/MazE/SpoVT family DNA-binding domain-containing protein [Bacillota bacterium]
MGFHKDSKGQYFGTTVKIGPKGQIVIPKEIRDMFGFQPGDSVLLLADRKRGTVIQSIDTMTPFMKMAFREIQQEENESEEEKDE